MYLLKEIQGRKFIKKVKIFENPERLRNVFHPLRWKILMLLAEKPMHALEIAKALKEHEQKIYYHLKQLENNGLVKIVKNVHIRGTLAKIYAPSAHAFAFELPGNEIAVDFPVKKRSENVLKFLFPHIISGKFNGAIVVGSPDPHGPYQVRARDGHYAVQLAYWLGQFAEANDFIVKLDVDVKAEKSWDENLIVVGGILTNVITAEINSYLPVKFCEKSFPFRKIISEITGKTYDDEKCGVIAKIPNPYCKEKSIILLAGVRNIGTKASILALTKFSDKVLRDYEGEDTWARIVKGLDLDGDGKIDSIEILE
ncbi:MAG TPA: ArsR family transcriptional regulator [Pyrodictiaceae archaeon]|nr:ArsR family transcriptional regulator [Pyrodictiaceae archaeon]